MSHIYRKAYIAAASYRDLELARRFCTSRSWGLMPDIRLERVLSRYDFEAVESWDDDRVRKIYVRIVGDLWRVDSLREDLAPLGWRVTDADPSRPQRS